MKLTEKEAIALGLIDKPSKKRTTGKKAPAADCTPTRCVTCDVVFTRPVDEDRHFQSNPGHNRYECVL